MTAISKFTSYKVTGNTFAFRDKLKSAGGRWDKPSQSWIVQVGGMASVGNARYALEQCEKGGCKIEKI